MRYSDPVRRRSRSHRCRRLALTGGLTVGLLALVLIAGVMATSAATSADTRPWPVKRQGDRDGDGNVRVIQLLLRERGYRVAADGIFGPRTDRAVRRLQARHGLEPDGVVGRRTWPRLVVTVRYGSRGDAVRAVQLRLRQNGEYGGAIDGIFGSRTRRAVRSFQRHVWLRVDGIVGRTTWNRLVTWGNND